jgi:hypothetical protein
VGEGGELLEQDRRQPELLEVEAVGVRREVGDQAEVPLDDHALASVADLPVRHLDAGAVHRLGDAVGLEHLERRGVERSRAVIGGERGLGLDHAHRHALGGERERGGEADRAGPDDQDRVLICFFHSPASPRSFS